MAITAEAVIAAATNSGLRVRSYSGRGMYGKECVGIGGQSQGQIFSELMDQMNSKSISILMREVRVDSLGLGVILYWPKLIWPSKQPIQEG